VNTEGKPVFMTKEKTRPLERRPEGCPAVRAGKARRPSREGRASTVRSTAAAPPTGGDDEPLSAGRLEIVDRLTGGIGADAFVHQNLDAVDLLRRQFVVWLVQSQPQAGPPSAEAFDDQSQLLAGVLSQNVFQDIPGLCADPEHIRTPFR